MQQLDNIQELLTELNNSTESVNNTLSTMLKNVRSLREQELASYEADKEILEACSKAIESAEVRMQENHEARIGRIDKVIDELMESDLLAQEKKTTKKRKARKPSQTQQAKAPPLEINEAEFHAVAKTPESDDG